jgi:hypothetical protein
VFKAFGLSAPDVRDEHLNVSIPAESTFLVDLADMPGCRMAKEHLLDGGILFAELS